MWDMIRMCQIYSQLDVRCDILGSSIHWFNPLPWVRVCVCACVCVCVGVCVCGCVCVFYDVFLFIKGN